MEHLNPHPPVKIVFTSEESKKFGLPIYRHHGDAGFDLHVILEGEDRQHGLTIHPYERRLLSAGIRVGLPPGYWARITHRSSSEKKLRLRVIEGTIDQAFIGDLYVHVANDNSYPINVPHGGRIGQMIIMPLVTGVFEEALSLESTGRGTSGFGSTG